MRPIQAIICFNSGSGGDFLKSICNEQLVETYNQYQIRDDGCVDLDANNFKQLVEDIFYNRATVDNLSSIDVEPIENSHYYIEHFESITTNLFYIDYPDNLNPNIIESYVAKRLRGDQTKFFDSFRSSLPGFIKNKLTTENLYKSSEINWLKNVKSWRANSNLQRVALQDFFDQDTCCSVVKTITGLDSLNEQRFLKTYNHWVANNNYLKELFTK